MSDQTESARASGRDLAAELLHTIGRKPVKLVRYKIKCMIATMQAMASVVVAQRLTSSLDPSMQLADDLVRIKT